MMRNNYSLQVQQIIFIGRRDAAEKILIFFRTLCKQTREVDIKGDIMLIGILHEVRQRRYFLSLQS